MLVMQPFFNFFKGQTYLGITLSPRLTEKTNKNFIHHEAPRTLTWSALLLQGKLHSSFMSKMTGGSDIEFQLLLCHLRLCLLSKEVFQSSKQGVILSRGGITSHSFILFPVVVQINLKEMEQSRHCCTLLTIYHPVCS